MAFEFRLRAVQKVQAFHRDEEKQTLAEMLKEQQEIEAEIEILEKKLAELQMRHNTLIRSRNLRPEILLQYSRCESQIQKNIVKIKNDNRKLQTIIESQRNTLLNSEREVKKFEKLEEKQREIYNKTHASEKRSEIQ